MQKILIVEDDKKLRQELGTFLNKNGFQAKGLEKFDNTIQDILNENSGRNPEKIDCNGFILNVAERVIEKDNKKIDLTKNEYSILYYLSTHKEKVVSRDEIMDYLWESEEFIDDNTLNVNIKRLRTKLEELGVKDKIETKRGQGYLLK